MMQVACNISCGHAQQNHIGQIMLNSDPFPRVPCCEEVEIRLLLQRTGAYDWHPLSLDTSPWASCWDQRNFQYLDTGAYTAQYTLSCTLPCLDWIKADM